LLATTNNKTIVEDKMFRQTQNTSRDCVAWRRRAAAAASTSACAGARQCRAIAQTTTAHRYRRRPTQYILLMYCRNVFFREFMISWENIEMFGVLFASAIEFVFFFHLPDVLQSIQVRLPKNNQDLKTMPTHINHNQKR
jgi:hypothetical protein